MGRSFSFLLKEMCGRPEKFLDRKHPLSGLYMFLEEQEEEDRTQVYGI